jgi:hypothetical protein
MNGFVNAYQRGFELPEGCRDLIEVLHKGAQAQPPKRDRFADVGYYITKCVKSPARRCSLSIFSWQPVDQFPLSLIRVDGVLYAFIILVKCTHPLREMFVREVFSERGIAPTQDSLIGAGGDQYRLLLYTLPTQARKAAALVVELLKRGYQLPEDAALRFHLDESALVDRILSGFNP